MKFEIKTRLQSGNIERFFIESASKADVFKELGKRGINAISVREMSVKPKKRSLSFVCICAISLLLIGIFIAGFWWLKSNMLNNRDLIAANEQLSEPVAIVEVKPDLSAEVSALKEKVQSGDVKIKTEVADTNIVWVSKTKYVKTMQNGAQVTVYAGDPDVKREQPIFQSDLNNFLVNYMEPGVPIPPTPIEFTDQQILDALMEKPEFNDEDTEIATFAKQNIEVMQRQLKAYIEEGLSVRDFLKDIQDRQDRESDRMAEARKMIMESIRNDSIEEARELYKALNKHLNENGLPNMRMPNRFLKIIEEE